MWRYGWVDTDAEMQKCGYDVDADMRICGYADAKMLEMYLRISAFLHPHPHLYMRTCASPHIRIRRCDAEMRCGDAKMRVRRCGCGESDVDAEMRRCGCGNAEM
jgi:hypothetical protein